MNVYNQITKLEWNMSTSFTEHGNQRNSTSQHRWRCYWILYRHRGFSQWQVSCSFHCHILTHIM